MRLTSRGRHAVSAMVDLHKNCPNGCQKPVTLASIAERQFISLSYLEQLFRNLRESGLVRSVRGPGGGYFLNREADKISIANIVNAVNEPMHATVCENAARGCHRGNRCDTHQLWRSLEQYIFQFMKNVNLQQVAAQQVSIEAMDISNWDFSEQDQTADVIIANIS